MSSRSPKTWHRTPRVEKLLSPHRWRRRVVLGVQGWAGRPGCGGVNGLALPSRKRAGLLESQRVHCLLWLSPTRTTFTIPASSPTGAAGSCQRRQRRVSVGPPVWAVSSEMSSWRVADPGGGLPGGCPVPARSASEVHMTCVQTSACHRDSEPLCTITTANTVLGAFQCE